SLYESDPRWVERLVQLSQQPFPKTANNNGGYSMSGGMTTTIDANGRSQLMKGNPAIAALCNINSPASVRAVVAAFSSNDAETRETAILSSLVEPGRSDPERIEALAAHLNDPSDVIRTHAMEELAQLGDKRVIPLLKEAVAKPGPARNGGGGIDM